MLIIEFKIQLFLLVIPTKIQWIKYLSPLFGMMFCPLTILFLWTIWSEPVINPEPGFVEKVEP
ncbi:hypothetical protein DNJ73_05395 [Prochlorococcus marinus XMU1408]|uniref:Uncharacterized protein n=1 Tax=Prochlorococcus marinus XMU1408 TaxID=2213228 RepID=A0A318R6K5_PROMR|nr:hypothetical protein [Prochlorococcus marinus str. XMU1408]PYE03172.1 hypothetical protein DNJ73_05395 [Prochlorococcus marinus XMU1408]